MTPLIIVSKSLISNMICLISRLKVRREGLEVRGGWGGVTGGYHEGCHPEKHHGKTSLAGIQTISEILFLFNFLA